jgi:hypothetical protein
MKSQLFEQISSLSHSEFSKDTIQEGFSLVEGYTYIDTASSSSGNTATVNGNNMNLYNQLQTTLSKDPKYDFNGNTLLFSYENLLISEQVKKDNEMLITSEDNLLIASSIAAATMFIVAFFLIGSKK